MSMVACWWFYRAAFIAVVTLILLLSGRNTKGQAAGTPHWIGIEPTSSPGAPHVQWTAFVAQPGVTELTVTLAGVWAEQVLQSGEPATRVWIEGQMGNEANLAVPDLPVVRWRVEVPPDVQVSLDITRVFEQAVSLANLGLPVKVQTRQPEQCKCDAESITPPGNDDPSAMQPLALAGEFVIRGRRVVVIEVRPVRYDSEAGSLVLYGEMHARLTFGSSAMGQGSQALSLQSSLRMAAENTMRYSGEIDSPVIDLSLADLLPEGMGVAPQAASQTGYLIISPDAYADALEPFVKLKQAEGYVVTLAKLSQIGHSPEAIRDYIRKAYTTWGVPPAYLLLVGDMDNGVDSLPAWQGKVSLGATDLYYAALDGSDWVPDILVGRVPARDVGQVHAWVQRSLNFALRQGSEAWLRAASFLATCDHIYFGMAEETHSYVSDTLTTPKGFMGNYPMIPQPGGDRLYCIGNGASVGNIQSALMAGRSLVVYSGHGTRYSWEMGVSINSLVAPSPTGAAPIVTSFACQTGDFGFPESLGEAWIRRGGALAFLGASDNTYWNTDDVFQRAVFKRLFEGPSVTLGDAVLTGLATVEQYYPGMGQYHYETYNLLGDPSLKPLAEPPPAIPQPEELGIYRIWNPFIITR